VGRFALAGVLDGTGSRSKPATLLARLPDVLDYLLALVEGNQERSTSGMMPSSNDRLDVSS
jgi:hypothetical protein